MKKLSLSLAALLPLAASAQAASSGFFSGLMELLFIVLVLFGIFLLLRELFCWYYKINERIKKQEKMIENQEKLIRLLTEIVEKKGENS